jgi:uncharacterized protein
MTLVKQIGWLLLEWVLYFLLFALIAFGLYAIISWLRPGIFTNATDINESTDPFTLLISSGFGFLFVASIFTAWAIYRWLVQRPFTDLGFEWNHIARPFGMGWAASMGMVLAGTVLIWLFGQIRFLTPQWSAYYFFGFLFFFILQSSAEEFVTRGYLIPSVEHRFGTLPALILSGGLFAFLHLGNDNFTWIGFSNILVGGFIMALLFIQFRNIWICAGYHAGWNFIQASLLDFNVSGVDTYSVFQMQDIGYARLSGAAFGYEGSLIALALQIGLLFYLVKKYQPVLKPYPALNLPFIHKMPTSEEPGINPSEANDMLWIPTQPIDPLATNNSNSIDANSDTEMDRVKPIIQDDSKHQLGDST